MTQVTITTLWKDVELVGELIVRQFLNIVLVQPQIQRCEYTHNSMLTAQQSMSLSPSALFVQSVMVDVLCILALYVLKK